MIRYFSTIIKKPPITITNNAWNKVDEILKNTNSKGMIFYASSGGCNGFNYKFDIVKKEEEIDKGYSLIECNNSKVYIEPKSEFYLLGTTIDYQTENFQEGIYDSKFIFKADKTLVSTCGCGVSFTPNEL